MKMSKKDAMFALSILPLLFAMSLGLTVVMVFHGYIEQSQMSYSIRVANDLSALSSAMVSYYRDHLTWPSNLSALIPTYFPYNIQNPWGGAYTVNSSGHIITNHIPAYTQGYISDRIDNTTITSAGNGYINVDVQVVAR